MWIDVYVKDNDGVRHFKQRVQRPLDDAAMHELHLLMCKHLSDSPMQPLPLDSVELVGYPPAVQSSVDSACES